MANRAIDWAIELKLDSTSKLVLFVLANRADSKNFGCYPSLARIARDTGLNKSTVARTLIRLEARGCLSRRRRRVSAKTNLSTLYTLHVPEGDQSQAQSATRNHAVEDQGGRRVTRRGVAGSNRESPTRTPIESQRASQVFKGENGRPAQSEEAAKAWRTIEPLIKEDMGPQHYNTWVRPIVLFEIERRRDSVWWRFDVPTEHFRSFLAEREHIFLAAAKAAGINELVGCQFENREENGCDNES